MQTLRDRIWNVLAAAFAVQEQVREQNQEGIAAMMRGDTERALQKFLAALGLAGSDKQLRAQCLINIGDWVRRFAGDLPLALEIFQEAAALPSDLLSKSRLRAMQAMVYSYPTEHGEHDPEGIAENIRLLQAAIKLAQMAAEIDPVAGFQAESFALHRLAGTVCNWGTDEQKAKCLKRIEEFLPKLHQNDPEVARFNYSKALIIASARPHEAISLLQASAQRMWTESPGDAGAYLVHAAEIALRAGKRILARAFLASAERDFASHLEEGFIGQIRDRVRTALEEDSAL